MSILESITTPETRPNALSWIIYGKPKVGKTTLACQFPAPLLIDIEGGTSFMQVPQFPLKSLAAEGKKPLDLLRSLYTELKANPGTYQTVIIDTADELFKVIAAPHKQNGVIPLKAYQIIYEQFTGILESYKALGIDVVMTAHEKQITDEDGGGIIQTTIALPGQLADNTGGRVDEIIYLTVKSVPIEGTEEFRQARYAVCQPTAHKSLGVINAGDRSSVLPSYIIDPSYEDLAAAKEATPRGLFDGKGDAVEDEPTEEPDNSDVADLFEGKKK
jgi:hypothetical protein